MQKIKEIKHTFIALKFSLFLYFMVSNFYVSAQQAGMRGYTFDAEKYKVDIEMQKLKAQTISSFTPTEPKYYSSSNNTPIIKLNYKAPKFPKDTLVFMADKFLTKLDAFIFYAGEDSLLTSTEKSQIQPELSLTGDLKYKNSKIYTLAYLYTYHYNKEAMEKINFHSNKSTTVWVQSNGGSDKDFFSLNTAIEKASLSDDYFFQINNNGEVKITFIKNGAKQGDIFKNKTSSWRKNQLNELSVVKIGEMLNFLCNGEIIHSVKLEHPWTRMFTNLRVDYGAQLKLKRYMHVFYPI